MRSHAVVEVERSYDSSGARTRIRRLRSEGAIVLRPTSEALPRWADSWDIGGAALASVRVAAAAAGPLGGDHWRLDIRVGEGAALRLGAVAATLVLPGAHGDESLSEINISVAAGGTLVWLPGAQIAARGCRHSTITRIDVAAGGRLHAREESVLGRHDEMPGKFRQRLRVMQDDAAIYDQELSVGPGTPGWRSAAVTGGRRALGSILTVDPDGATGPPAQAVNPGIPDTAVFQLSETATLISGLAPNAVDLRIRLENAFALLTASRDRIPASSAVIA